MKHVLTLAVGMLGAMICWGCATRISPSTADGTYLNLNGEAVNVYTESSARTIQVGLETLASLEIPVLSRRAGRHKTIIMAKAPDGSPLRLRFVDQGRERTLVTIQTGNTGFWDHEFSFLLHAALHNRLMSAAQPKTERDPARSSIAAKPPRESGTGVSGPRTAPSGPSPTPAPQRARKPIAEPRGETKTGQAASQSALALPSPPQDRHVTPQRSKPDTTVFFEADSNLPGPQEMTKLDRAALRVLADPALKIILTGFAGRTENGGRAQLVSESRVLAVKFYLIGRGVAPGRIAAVAHEVVGDARPSDTRDIRRVEIRIFPVP